MSKSRGLLPLALAIAFGIVNGVATFGPAFKDQAREKLERKLKEAEGAESAKSAGVPQEVKVVGLVGTVKENASWRSVFGLRDGAKAAIKADDQGGKSLLRGMRDE